MTPQRIAVAGDWHGNFEYAVNSISRARDLGADIILHTGDFGYWPDALAVLDMPDGTPWVIRDNDSWRFGEALDEALRKFELNLWFVDGNHEVHDVLLSQPLDPSTGRRPVRERIEHLPRGHRWRWGQSTWLALGGAASVDRLWRTEGRNWWPHEVVSDEQAAAAIACGPADVMLCHDGPWSVPHLLDRYSDANGWPEEDVARSNANRRRIEKVMTGTGVGTLFHGHYHDSYTQVFHLGGLPRTVTGLGADNGPICENLVIVGPDGQPLNE